MGKNVASSVFFLIPFLLPSQVAAQSSVLSPVAGNNAPQIQAALDQANAGESVLLSAGDYDISERLMINKTGITLAGSGGQAVIKPSSAFPAYPADENCLICIWIPGSTAAVNSTNINQLTLDGSTNSNVLNGILAKRGGLHHFSGLTIRNIAPNSAESTGISLSSSKQVTIVGNTIEFIGRNGISASANSDYVTIRGNFIHHVGDNFASSSYSTTGLSIELTRTESGGVPMEGSDFGVIENNVVDGFISVGGSSHIAIRNNTIGSQDALTRYAGIEVAGSSPDTPGESAVIISGNTILGPAFHGGIINGVTFTAVGNNYPSSNVKYALVHDNTVTNAEMAGINVEGINGGLVSHLVLDNNTTEQGKAGGIGFEGDGEGVTLTGNVRNISLYHANIRNNDRNGIKLSTQAGACPNRLTIAYSRITGNGQASIGGCNIAGNTFGTNNPADPPYLFWQNNIVSGNNVNTQLASVGFSSANQAPHISVSVVSAQGNTVTYKAQIQDDPNDKHTLLWDFGDGVPVKQDNIGAESFITHTHTTGPAGHATVAVWDLAGRSGIASLTPAINSSHPVLAPIYLLLLD